jgi:hypothetical protein
MDYFFDNQVERYLVQFINVMSNIAYKDAKGNLTQIPTRYGDMTRQVGQLLRKNSENTIPSAPFISCYIKDMQYDRPRMQDPTFISKIHIKERAFDENNQEYLNIQGSNYTVERIMPVPYIATFAADIWTTNTRQKFQIWEQLVVLFNPSLELQTTDNYIDWTSLSLLELTNQTWSSRTIPQGVADDIDIMNLTFTAPIWITPPAKVKKLGIITKIISNVFAVGAKGTIGASYDKDGAADLFGDISPDTTITITPGNYDLLVLNNTARLIKSSGAGEDISSPNNSVSWLSILDLYPGKFRAGLSQLRFMQPNDNEVVAYISLDPSDDLGMMLTIDTDTVPSNTNIAGRGTVDAVINPETFNPNNPASNTRYLILENIHSTTEDGPIAWQQSNGNGFSANANDIIEWDGSQWTVVFNSAAQHGVVYITNAYTGTQYKWDQGAWSKTYEGVYDANLWRLVL